MKSFHRIACTAGVLGALVTSGLATSPLGLSAASAAPAFKATLKISGAGSGTLKPGQYSGCLNQSVKTNGLTAVNGLAGSISGFTNDVGYWSLDVTVKKLGTSRLTGNLSAKPIGELFAAAKDNNFSKVQNDQFFAKSGSVTVSTTTGSINASFANTPGKVIKVVGTWTC
jgi:hypothetical protein